MNFGTKSLTKCTDERCVIIKGHPLQLDDIELNVSCVKSKIEEIA